MPERHLHFNVLTLVWLFVAIKVIEVPIRVAARKFYVPGVSEILSQ